MGERNKAEMDEVLKNVDCIQNFISHIQFYSIYKPVL